MDYHHFGAIVNATLLNWSLYFKWDKLWLIVNISNFAVVYTPTSVEVGEGITAKFACVDFAISKDSCLCVPTSKLVVALRLYGVLLMVTLLRYGRYSSFGMVT